MSICLAQTNLKCFRLHPNAIPVSEEPTSVGGNVNENSQDEEQPIPKAGYWEQDDVHQRCPGYENNTQDRPDDCVER